MSAFVTGASVVSYLHLRGSETLLESETVIILKYRLTPTADSLKSFTQKCVIPSMHLSICEV